MTRPRTSPVSHVPSPRSSIRSNDADGVLHVNPGADQRAKAAGRVRTLVAAAALAVLAHACAPATPPPARAALPASAPSAAASGSEPSATSGVSASPAEREELLHLPDGSTRSIPRASTPATAERPTYPSGDHPLLIISDNHLDCPADHPRALVPHVEVAEGRICLQSFSHHDDFQRWIFAPADPPSDSPPRRRRYRLCLDHLGALWRKNMLVRGIRLPIAIAAADFPGGEVPELINLRLEHTTNPDHAPGRCDLLYPTVRVTGGAPLPDAVNLPQPTPIH